MSGWGLIFLTLFGGLLLLSMWNARQREKRLKDPNSPEAIQAGKVWDALTLQQRDAISREAKAGRALNAIAQLRRSVPGLGLETAKDVIELLRGETN